MSGVADEVRRAARGLVRAPGFAATAILTLALGIGLSTAVFTIADGILLRRLPVADERRLVTLWGATRDGRFSNVPVTLQDAKDFERGAQTLDGVAFHTFRGATPAPIRSGDQVYTVQTALVSGNFFDVLQSRAILGRALRPEDDVAGAAPVVVLSHKAWQRQFGGDSSIVGRSITWFYTGHTYTIVGVMPQGLEYPTSTDVWLPVIAHGSAGGFLEIVTGELDLVARLRANASPEAARAELASFFSRSKKPEYRDIRAVAHRLPDVVFGNTKPAILLVMLAAGLLLAITCVNVMNLLIVRALGRTRELVVRAALGADRRRLIGQLLTESALLSLAGGVLGVALAAAAVRGFVSLAPTTIPRLDGIALNSEAVVVALGITTVAMLISSVWPAVFASGANAQDALRSGSRNTGGRGLTRTAEVLVAAQIALAAVSMVAAGLVIKSFVKLRNADLSFNRGDLVVAQLGRRPDPARAAVNQRASLELAVRNVTALPGVEGVSPVFAVPFTGGGGGIDGTMSLPGQAGGASARYPMLNLEMAASNYFTMLGVPLIRGRFFRDDDREGTERVIVISASVARHFWPAGDPIGKRLASGKDQYTVVGVVPDTRYRELENARSTVYFPLSQLPFGGMVPSILLIRAAPSAATAAVLQRAVAEADPRLSVLSVSSLENLLDGPRARPRLNAVVLALFGAAAGALASIGLFAIVATMVRHRTRELGIRMALGSTAGEVFKLIMARGLAIAGAGVIIGTVATFAVDRLLLSLLFEISPTDPVTLVSVVAVLLGVATVASLIPARLSMRIDPAIALRSES